MLSYYARAVNNKSLTALSAFSVQQAAATEKTKDVTNQVLDYVATYPNDGITYYAINMILASHLDAAYLNKPKS